jgi:predicted ATPase
MLSHEVRSYQEAQELAGPVIFDRGVPDVVGCLIMAGLPVPCHIERAALRFRYPSPWRRRVQFVRQIIG